MFQICSDMFLCCCCRILLINFCRLGKGPLISSNQRVIYILFYTIVLCATPYQKIVPRLGKRLNKIVFLLSFYLCCLQLYIPVRPQHVTGEIQIDGLVLSFYLQEGFQPLFQKIFKKFDNIGKRLVCIKMQHLQAYLVSESLLQGLPFTETRCGPICVLY